MSKEWKERENTLSKLLASGGFADQEILEVRQKFANVLQMLADPNTSVDSGMGCDGEMGFYPTINGKEYLVTVKQQPPKKGG